jgi:hypothetical protein
VHIRVGDLLFDGDPPQIHIVHAKRGADRYVPVLPGAGGDQNPLTWSSLRNVIGQAVNYERAAENHSDQDLTDVYWPVAGYARDLLPAKTPICDQTTIPGETDTRKGPLNYGPGSSAVYQTASYCPKDGWPSGQLGSLLPTKEPLSSEIQVALRSAPGKIAVCTLRLLSTVTPDYSKGTIKYQYDLENFGPKDLRVFGIFHEVNNLRSSF